MKIGNKVKLAVLAAIFATIAVGVNSSPTLAKDVAVANFIYSLRNPILTGIMLASTFLGSIPFIAIGAIAIIVILRIKKEAAYSNFFLITLTASVVADNLLKYLIRRPRPNIAPLDNGMTYSYPSGHAMNSLVFYGLIAYFAHRYIKDKCTRTAVDIVAAALVLLIGFSRVYLGAHYPTDVAGGFVAGGIVLITAITIEKRSRS